MTLTESTTSIAEIFRRDPLGLSTTDLDTAITALRAQRKRFQLGNTKAGTPGSKKSATSKAQEAALDAAGKIDLGDLGI